MRLLLAGCLLLLLVPAPYACAGVLTDEQVGQAMVRMRGYLYSLQDPRTGAWDHPDFDQGSQRGGVHALVILALLTSGESPQNPPLAKAVQHLARLRMEGTYAVALRAHVWAQLPAAYRPHLERDTAQLLAGADADGWFGYLTPGGGGVNFSTTHFGVLGLWEAARRGVAVPPRFWQRSEVSLLAAQSGDGGWGYVPRASSTGTMTAAGLTLLLITQQQAHRTAPAPPPRVAESITRGVDWLDRNFHERAYEGNPHDLYYLYAVERVALACGVRYLNGRDWFAAGAGYLLNAQAPGGEPADADAGSIGGNVIRTALALMFLSRGRVPVWATKLAVSGQAWNNRPNDLHFLTQYLSDHREAELNWQCVNLDTPAEQWANTPVAFLASDNALRLSGLQKAQLRRYLDLGGMLVAHPDGGSGAFSRSIRELAEELYPQWPMRRLPPQHPLLNCAYQLSRRGSQPVFGVSNGAREMIILANRDWGFAWQSPRAANSPAWEMGVNLWALATDGGLIAPRLVERLPARQPRPVVGELSIGQAALPGAPGLYEPAAWDAMAGHFFNRTGIQLQQVAMDLDQLGATRPPALLHLASVRAVAFSQPQLQALAEYARAGGTILVETLGGGGEFARDFERQMTPFLQQGASELERSDPLITGQGLGSGAHDNRRITFRRYAILTRRLSPVPRLAAYRFDDRPAIILSSQDLSLGMMGVNHWAVNGYSVESARRLITNILLHASRPAGSFPREDDSNQRNRPGSTLK